MKSILNAGAVVLLLAACVSGAQGAAVQPGGAARQTQAPAAAPARGARPPMMPVRLPVDLAIVSAWCQSSAAQERDSLTADSSALCRLQVRNLGSEVAYLRDFGLSARILANGADASYRVEPATRQNCTGLSLSVDHGGPNSRFVDGGGYSNPSHLLPGGEGPFTFSLRTPLAADNLEIRVSLSHPRDTNLLNNTYALRYQTVPLRSGSLCSVEPPIASSGQIVKARGYLLTQNGRPAPLRFGRLPAEVVRSSRDELDIRVPAMTCAGSGTNVELPGVSNPSVSRTVVFQLPQPQNCPPPRLLSVVPDTAAPGQIVTLNVDNIGPSDPNIRVRFDGAGNWMLDQIESVSVNQVRVRIPSNATGTVGITLSNAHGSVTATVPVR